MSIATAESNTKSAWRTRRWTTAQFDSLMVDGLLREGSKTFLWDGEIFDPLPETERHAHAQDNLCNIFLRRIPEMEWTIYPAHPLALKEGYKPQPDIIVLFGPRSDYRRRVPASADVALIVEIADSTYLEDAGDKLPEYAAAGIPRYWIVHIRARRIEAYSGPIVSSGVGRYADRKDYPLEAAVPLVLERGGLAHEFVAIPVLEVLRDSLEGD